MARKGKTMKFVQVRLVRFNLPLLSYIRTRLDDDSLLLLYEASDL
jgi:hypothetical protein